MAGELKVRGLDHIVLAVADAEASLAFYCGRLGLRPERVDEWRRREAPFPSVRVDATTIIDLLPRPPTGGNLDHFCLVVDATDFGAVAAGGGFEVAEGPVRRWGAQGEGTSLYVRDPDANLVELRYYGSLSRAPVNLRIEPVGADATHPLRQRVLRPHQTVEEVSYPGDDDADAGHYGAVDDGEVVGVVSVRRQPPPWAPDADPAWRLRGMATAEDRRRQGIGAALLAAAVGHVGARGGGLLWCNARLAAVPFYLRGGFVPRGESWVEPFIGPHLAMEVVVDAGPGPVR